MQAKCWRAEFPTMVPIPLLKQLLVQLKLHRCGRVDVTLPALPAVHALESVGGGGWVDRWVVGVGMDAGKMLAG